MNTDATGAHARQFKRHATEFEASLEPHSDHVEQFRLTYPNAKCGLAVTDVSRGGMGLLAGIFLPRNLRLTVHVKTTRADDRPPLVVRTIVRRCALTDPKPTYQVGLQFLDPEGVDEKALVRAVEKSQENEKAQVEEGVGVG
jgi:c-di-GMP-binding flagellar brake protein YcgR